MGFLSKAWKSVKKVAKEVGKGIKKATKSVGKFMNKIGIAGQIALMFVLPGVGAMIGKGVAALAGSSNALLSGVGKVLQVAGKFAHTAGNAFKTVTDGIMSFVNNVGRGVINSTAKALGAKAPLVGGPETITKGFSTWMEGVAADVQNIASPFKAPALEVSSQVENTYSKAMDPETVLDSIPTEAPVEDFRFYEVPKDKFAQIIETERRGFTGFLKSTADYATGAVKQLPEKVVDYASESIAKGAASMASQSLGLEPKPEYNVTNVTRNIPEFRSNPISNRYETAGLNYGAIPDNRIQFFAASEIGFGDFGASSFAQFRPVGA